MYITHLRSVEVDEPNSRQVRHFVKQIRGVDRAALGCLSRQFVAKMAGILDSILQKMNEGGKRGVVLKVRRHDLREGLKEATIRD